MNRLILLAILLFSMQGFSQEKIIVKKGDTIVAKADQVFTIEDLNKPSKPPLKKVVTQVPPVTINNYIPEQSIYNPEPAIVNHYYSNDNTIQISVSDIIIISFVIMAIMLLLYHYVTDRFLFSHNCDYKKEPATINTFHINGGDANALIDKSVKNKSSCSHDLHQNYPMDEVGETFIEKIASDQLDEEEEERTRSIAKDVISKLQKEVVEDFPT